MTEEEWDYCGDPYAMLDCLGDSRSDRKLRFFAVASCRRAWDLLTNASYQRLLLSAERHAKGEVTYEQLHHEAREVLGTDRPLFDSDRKEFAAEAALRTAAADIHAVLPDILYRLRKVSGAPSSTEEYREHSRLLRDIFGNPFRPVAIDPRWLTASVLDLARAIYDGRAFEHMPILADALMDAGCGNEDIINHCRGDGPHVRGCWVVDLILGKT
jgi:hypothetical protein